MQITPTILPPYQPLYNRFSGDDSPSIWVFYGSYESGKSYGIEQYKLIHLIKETEAGRPPRWLVLRKNASTNLDSTFALAKDLISDLGLFDKFTITKSPMRISYTSGGHTGEIIYSGLLEPEKLKSVSGITNIHIEELKECTESDFLQARARLRAGDKEMIVSFNPAFKSHWIYKHFFLNDYYGSRCEKIKTTWRDNPYLSDDRKAYYESLKEINYEEWLIASEGEWVDLGAQVFSRIKVQELDANYDAYDDIYVGLDFGFSHYTACLVMGMREETLYILDEWCKLRVTQDVVNTEMVRWLEERGLQNKRIVADSAEPARINDLRSSGLRYITGARKARNSILEGINYLKARDIYIDSHCVVSIEQFSGLSYSKTRDGVFTEDVVGVNDDTVAAARYGLQDRIAMKKPGKIYTRPAFAL